MSSSALDRIGILSEEEVNLILEHRKNCERLIGYNEAVRTCRSYLKSIAETLSNNRDPESAKNFNQACEMLSQFCISSYPPPPR